MSPAPDASASMAAKDTAAEDESSSSTPTMIGPSSNVQSSATTTAGTGERETVRNGSHPVKADRTRRRR